ncbi:MAG: phosphonoacetaldehyde hydrolase, partial [Fusobacteriaceae bacterium]
CFAPLEVFMKIFKEAGIEITYEEARKPMGLLKIDHTRALLEMERIKELWNKKYGRDYTEEDLNKLYSRFEEVLFQNLENFATPIPGVLKLVENLRKKGIKIGSTTGYTKEMLDIVAENAEELGYQPDFRVTATEVPSGRPYPYMIYKNMIELQLADRKSVIKVGDTISDIKEGKGAGVWAVGILKGGSELGFSREEVEKMEPTLLRYYMDKTARRFFDAGADYVVDEIGDLEKIIDIIENQSGV